MDQLHKLEEIINTYKDKLNSGEYLELMNCTKEIFKKLKEDVYEITIIYPTVQEELCEIDNTTSTLVNITKKTFRSKLNTDINSENVIKNLSKGAIVHVSDLEQNFTDFPELEESISHIGAAEVKVRLPDEEEDVWIREVVPIRKDFEFIHIYVEKIEKVIEN